MKSTQRKPTARLPDLGMEIVHRRPPDGDTEQIGVNIPDPYSQAGVPRKRGLQIEAPRRRHHRLQSTLDRLGQEGAICGRPAHDHWMNSPGSGQHTGHYLPAMIVPFIDQFTALATGFHFLHFLSCINVLHDERGRRSERAGTVKSDTRLLNRREFNGLGLALSSFVTASGAAALETATGVPSNGAGGIRLRDGTVVPALGQGSASLAKGRHPQAEEEEALRTGISLGMTLIDTAESYGSEEFIGRVIAGQRDHVFLVSKVSASHVAGNGITRACVASLSRLRTDYLDLYLLHWPNGITDFSGLVRAFENLRSARKIRAWGVSNFNISRLEKLFHVPQGDRCATNQVAYNIGDRGIEYDLLPWCEQHGMPVMAYSPLGGPGSSLLRDPTLARIGAAHGCSAAAVALAWTIRGGHVIAIPESGSVAHVKENAVALSLTLTPKELQALDAAHPPPSR